MARPSQRDFAPGQSGCGASCARGVILPPDVQYGLWLLGSIVKKTRAVDTARATSVINARARVARDKLRRPKLESIQVGPDRGSSS